MVSYGIGELAGATAEKQEEHHLLQIELGVATLAEDTAHSQCGADVAFSQPDGSEGCSGYTGLPASLFSVS